MEVTGWSRDNARRLVEAANRPSAVDRQVAVRQRKARAPKYSYDARKVLQRVWAASGSQGGLYLAASTVTQLDELQRHGNFSSAATGRGSLILTW